MRTTNEKWTDDMVVACLERAKAFVADGGCHRSTYVDGIDVEALVRLQAAIDEIRSHQPGKWVPGPDYRVSESWNGDDHRPYSQAGRALLCAPEPFDHGERARMLRDAQSIAEYRGWRN